MSGHSKWSTIKRAKGATDAKRAAQFTKVSREITIAARISGPDPAANPRLRLAIDKGRGLNMPNDNIKRAIERAAGLGQSDAYEEIVYEGYGPGGVAVLVEAATDNRNRTASEVRSLFTKSGGALASSGAVVEPTVAKSMASETLWTTAKSTAKCVATVRVSSIGSSRPGRDLVARAAMATTTVAVTIRALRTRRARAASSAFPAAARIVSRRPCTDSPVMTRLRFGAARRSGAARSRSLEALHQAQPRST